MKKTLILFLLIPLSILAKPKDKFDIFLEAKLVASPDVQTPYPNLNNVSSQVDMSGLSSSPPVGGGVTLGLEFLGNLPISFFGALQFNYQRTKSEDPNKRHIQLTGIELSSFQHKIRTVDGSFEAGVNFNLRLTSIMIQPYLSLETGIMRRFDRLSYTTSSADIDKFLRESRSEFDITRINLGVRLISIKGYFSNFRVSQTDLSQTKQSNIYYIDGIETRDSQEFYQGDNFDQIFSISVGIGTYF